MEKKANEESLILQPRLITLSMLFKVQSQTIKKITKNWNPLGLVLLVVIFTIFQFEFAVRCLLEEVSFRLSHHRDMRELLVENLLLLQCSCCIVLFFKEAMISSSIWSLCLHHKTLSLKDMLSRRRCFMYLLSLIKHSTIT